MSSESEKLKEEKRKPIIPEVCDRLKCKIPSCYGWDLCREAREEATAEEWAKLIDELFPEEGTKAETPDIRNILKCKYCKVTACPICELHGIISNMQRINDKFVCNTCHTEIWEKGEQP